MTETRAAYEAATLEAMHTGDYTAPDLEYTPITAPLPRLVRREVEELRQKEGREAAAEAEIDKLRAALAAERVRVAELEAHLAARQRRAEAAEKDANELRADNEMNAHYATRALHAEAALAAVPVGALRRYFEHSDAYRDVRNGKYEPEQELLDCQSIAEWLDQQLEPTP